jgi:hypothetical protein
MSTLAKPCELWSGVVNSSGYGPHQRIWEDNNGQLPEGYELHHECGNRSCVETTHLIALTISEHRQRHSILRRGEYKHGTRRMYEYKGCRCGVCRDFNADRQRAFQRSAGRKPRPKVQHGTRSMYVRYRCRCSPCVEASREYDRSRNRKAQKK